MPRGTLLCLVIAVSLISTLAEGQRKREIRLLPRIKAEEFITKYASFSPGKRSYDRSQLVGNYAIDNRFFSSQRVKNMALTQEETTRPSRKKNGNRTGVLRQRKEADQGLQATGGSRTLAMDKDPRSILYLHFRKCGGTGICTLAKLAGYKVTGSNCNLPEDGPWSLNITKRSPFGAFESCEERAAFIEKTGLGFTAEERYFDGEICPQFRYMTVFRHPISRIISNMIYDRYLPAQIMTWARKDTPATAMSGKTPIVDNYFIRTLNGVKGYFLPLGGVTREHLERAKELLLQFSVVMTLEDYENTSMQLRVGWGWPKSRAVINKTKDQLRNGSYRLYIASLRANLDKPLSPAEMEELKELNALDIELYEFAAALAHNKTQTVLQQKKRK